MDTPGGIQPIHDVLEFVGFEAQVVHRCRTSLPRRLCVEVKASLADSQEDVSCACEIIIEHHFRTEVLTPECDCGFNVGRHEMRVVEADHRCFRSF